MILVADLETLATSQMTFFGTVHEDFQYVNYCHKEIPLRQLIVPRSASGSLSLYSSTKLYWETFWTCITSNSKSNK